MVNDETESFRVILSCICQHCNISGTVAYSDNRFFPDYSPSFQSGRNSEAITGSKVKAKRTKIDISLMFLLKIILVSSLKRLNF